MKNKVVHQTSSTTGIFKKVFWPWLFVIAAILIPVYSYECLLIEFLSSEKICVDSCCNNFVSYLFHYTKTLDMMWMVVGALVLVAILCRILFVRKRKLTVANDAITYKKGTKVCKVPLSSINKVATKRNAVIIAVPSKKIKINRLKNKQQVYDAITTLLYGHVQTEASAIRAAVAQATDFPASLLAASSDRFPTTTQGKLRYFQGLLAARVITPEQYEKYTNSVFTTDFPNLY